MGFGFRTRIIGTYKLRTLYNVHRLLKSGESHLGFESAIVTGFGL